ncbi:hypothetical protein AM1_4203 [Acaryochloris marina MBIC11017]|uniref:Uncharacterized protein n=1 Tax=Acaryochloris marina (strain MBIC 11017) TaxID=329726 RepID=B0CCM1_ACAM1|nr:hypothetical protein AM1_4203 [Acaryochloris marina MBIC11017]
MAWQHFIPKNAKPSLSVQSPSTHSSTQEIHSEPFIPSEREKAHQPFPTPIDDKFIAQCKVELAFHIGPMVEIVV